MATPGHASSGAPLPSPAPTLPTPHFPGDFPVTPSPSAYHQTEGPLEAAGRSLDGPVALLEAAAGLVLGGVGGALAGVGLLGSAAKVEGEALALNAKKREESGGSGSETPKVGGGEDEDEDEGVTRAEVGQAAIVPAAASGTGRGEFVALDYPVHDRAKVTRTSPQPRAAMERS